MWWDKPGTAAKPARELKPWPFMRMKWLGFLVTGLVIAGTTISLAIQGLNLGLDFTGGIQVEAAQATPFDVDKVRTEVARAGFRESNITTADGGTTVLIRVPLEQGVDIEATTRQVTEALDEGVVIRGTSSVSGKVSGDTFNGSVIASLMAVLGIALYVWLRFEFKFGLAAFLTIFHDVYAIVGLFSITRLAFDLTIVAGVLTIAGYSINDKVVVFDRIREMLKKYKKLPLPEVIDISITATLSRTVMTALATLGAGAALVFLGGPVLFGLGVSIVAGIIIGTYSSIFVAAPMLTYLPGRMPGSRSGERNQDATQRSA
jgi:preprotein translocase subunit SecF